MTRSGDSDDRSERPIEPHLTAARRAARAARERRLAQALRDNLKRRKEQARAQQRNAETDQSQG